MTFSSINPPSLASATSDLNNWGLIRVQGPDANDFLQNQLTNSVAGLDLIPIGAKAAGPQQVRLVGYCTAKGRLLASAWLVLIQTTEPSYFLFISKDIAATFAKRLAMYVLRAKVEVSDLSDTWRVQGAWQQQGVAGSSDPEKSLGFTKQAVILTLPPTQLIIAGIAQTYNRYLLATPANAETLGVGADTAMWNYLEVMSAIPRIVLATQDQFVPQMINFESVYGVDFKKGCYPGQEIVARSQYRGAIKRRLYLAFSESKIPLENSALFQPGVEIFHSSDPTQPAGMVVLSAPNPFELGQVYFQIECKLEMANMANMTKAVPPSQLHLGLGNGPLLFLGEKLPYPLLEI
jgi:folate-binding protein YgfZ